jgi:hypothetical protein
MAKKGTGNFNHKSSLSPFFDSSEKMVGRKGIQVILNGFNAIWKKLDKGIFYPGNKFTQQLRSPLLRHWKR